MKQKKIPWKNHAGGSKYILFQPHEKKVVMLLFEMDIDHEIGKAKKTHWIQVKAQWRNLKSGGLKYLEKEAGELRNVKIKKEKRKNGT